MKQVCVPAKINLHLQVVGRRPDGFHELRTIFQSVGVWDVLCAEACSSPCLTLEVMGDQTVTSGPENLVLRAADALRRATGCTLGARFELTKNIPIGGGMGGGSADAAAALVLLNEVWDLGLKGEDLYEIAVTLGSDVPFFLTGGLALGTGRGEEVWPLPDLEPMSVLLVAPSVQISTAEIFCGLNRGREWVSMAGTVYSGLVADPPRIEWESVVNDLQAPVCDRFPEVANVLRMLEDGRCVRAAMTGSGSCVFALYRNQVDARRGARDIRETGVMVVSTLTRGQARLKVEDAGSAHGTLEAR